MMILNYRRFGSSNTPRSSAFSIIFVLIVTITTYISYNYKHIRTRKLLFEEIQTATTTSSVIKNIKEEIINNTDTSNDVSIIEEISKVKALETLYSNQLIPSEFEAWNRSKVPFPCVTESRPNTEGIFYIKLPKTSSTTLAKVTNRIAVREAKRQNLGEVKCKIHDPYTHQRATKINIGDRDKSKSFIWSVVRHPLDRMISHYGMRAKKGELDTTDFINSMDLHPPPRNIQLHFLSPEESPHSITDAEIAFHVEVILKEYNFIGLYEELDKSLVVLSMLAGVDINDVIYDFLPSKMNRCGSLEKPDWVTPEIDKYLSTDKWIDHHKADYILYDMVNKTFHKTIEKLGRDKVQAKLKQYQKLVQIGTTYAQEKMHLKGCGVPLLFPQIRPWNDIDELSWFTNLSPQDQAFVKQSSPRSWEESIIF